MIKKLVISHSNTKVLALLEEIEQKKAGMRKKVEKRIMERRLKPMA
jgi:hypothetical protein